MSLASSNNLFVFTFKPKSNHSLLLCHAFILHPTEVLSKKICIFFQAVLLFNIRTLEVNVTPAVQVCVYAISLVTEHRKLRSMGWDGLQWHNTTVSGFIDGLSDLELLLHELCTLL
jgi:hypothetical protein